MKSQHPLPTTIAIRLTVALAMFAVMMQGRVHGQTWNSSTPPTEQRHDGFVEPLKRILLAPTEIGRIDRVHVEIGQRVEANQLVASLESGMQTAAVWVATIQTNASAELKAAEAEVKLSKIRAEQLVELSKTDSAIPSEVIRAQTNVTIAEAQAELLRERSLLREAELERARVMLERRFIRAPQSGVISAILMNPGEYISPSRPAVVELLVDDKLIGLFNVPAENAYGMEVGASVKVQLVSTNRQVDGIIVSKTPKIDGSSGTVGVRVEIDNPDHQILSGDRCIMESSSLSIPANGRRAAKPIVPPTVITPGGHF